MSTATARPKTARGAIREVALKRVHESDQNPRKHYDPEALRLLAENLTTVGQLTPGIARPHPTIAGAYELAAGSRRRRALERAGIKTMLLVVRKMDDATFAEVLNIENLQRDDLNALEEAQGFVALMKDAGYDVPKIAERLGRSVKYVYDRIKLLQLIPEAKKLLLDGILTPGHGILLARLNKDDQKRALDDSGPNPYHQGGALQREMVSGSYFPGLDPERRTPVKARTVRELDQWIQQNVRFDPTQVDQGDLAFDLPDTADLLETAHQGQVKVVKITREYRVPDQARHESERTYGHDHWQRADGEPEPYDRWGQPAKGKKSQPCDHSVVGLVVAGPGRGEAFLVCVNKEKCPIHWSQWQAERTKRQQQQAARAGGGDAAEPAEPDPNVIPEELLRQWVTEEVQQRIERISAQVAAILPELTISDELVWNLMTGSVANHLYTWNKVGHHGHGERGTQYVRVIRPLVCAQLPGSWTQGQWDWRMNDAPAARAGLAFAIWHARDSGWIDPEIKQAVGQRWKQHRKAAGVQTSARQRKAATEGAESKPVTGGST